MLRGFKSKISSLGNIHFGKIVLVLVMIFSMLIGRFEIIHASEPLYYYDKHVGYKWSDEVVSTREFKTMYYDGEDGQGVRYYLSAKSPQWDGEKYVIQGAYNDTIAGWRYPNISNEFERVRTYRRRIDVQYPYDIWLDTNYTRTRLEGAGSHIDTIIALVGTYPFDGLHTDGYWYIRKGIVNIAPTLSITTPSGNSYFSK